MENLKEFCVQELTTEEMKKIDGGSFLILAISFIVGFIIGANMVLEGNMDS